MIRSALPLKIRVRYDGLVQTFDRRPQAEIDANVFHSPIRRTPSMKLPSETLRKLRVSKTALPTSKMTIPVPVPTLTPGTPVAAAKTASVGQAR